MNAFTHNDMGWTIRYASNHDDTHFGDDWREFFGDEYNWTSLVPLAWAAVGGPNARINPPKLGGEQEIFKLTSWWNMPLHLLAFGLGWTNLGQGLKRWREDGYPVENDILRLVFNTYGPSIEALELWLNASGYAGSIYSLLNELAHRRWQDMNFVRGEGDPSEQRERLQQQLNAGPRHRLMQRLVEGHDSDPLHLSGHFTASVGYEPVRPPKEHQVLRGQNSDFEILQLDQYQGWMSVLATRFDTAGWLEGAIHYKRVRVDIAGLGTLGTYVYCGPTGRTFRLNERSHLNQDQDASAEHQLRWHMLGN
jgi:hypothetical protein